MMILSLVRDYHNQHRIVNEGGWHIARKKKMSEGMHMVQSRQDVYDMLSTCKIAK